MDKARKLTKVAAESQGMAELKYQAYMESSEAATKRLQNAWEGLTNTFKASDAVKVFKDTVAWFVEHLTTIVSLIGSIGLSMKSMRTISGIQNAMQIGNTNVFKTLGHMTGDRIKGGWNTIRGYTTGEGVQYLPRITSYLQDIVNTTRQIAGKNPLSGTSATKNTQGTTRVKQTTMANPARGVFTASSGKQAMIGSDGKWHFVKKDGSLYTKSVGKEEAAKLDEQYQAYQKIQAKGGTLGQRAVRGLFGGIAAGVTSGVAAGVGFKNSDGEEASVDAKKAVGWSTGIATAVGTGLLSAIPYVGPVLGPTLGPILGSFFGTHIAPLLGNLIDQQAIARRERSRDAEKTYSTIKSIEGDTKSLKELSKENWDYEDYQKANASLSNIFTQLYGNTTAARALYEQKNGQGSADTLSDIEVVSKIKNWLTTEYLGGSEKTRNKAVNEWEKAVYEAEVKAYEASQEDTYYKNRTLLNTASIAGWQGVEGAVKEFVAENSDMAIIEGNKLRFLGASPEERLKGERQLLNFLADAGLEGTTFYKSLQKTIADTSTAFSGMTSSVDEINTKRTNAAAITANLSDFTSSQLKRMGIDEVARLILAQVNNAGGFTNLDQSKQQYYWTGSLESLAPTARQYIESYIKNDPMLYGILSGQSYTLEEVAKGGILQGEKKNQYLLSFAKQLNMTIEELNANLETYSSFSLSDIMKGYSDVKTALEEIDGIFNSIVSNTGLTADNLTTLLAKYPDLIDEAQTAEGLAGALFNKTLGYLEVQRNNLLNDLGTNTSVFEKWKQSLTTEVQETLEKIGGLGNLSNGTSFWEAWLNLSNEDKNTLGDKYKEIQDSFTRYFNSFSWEVNIDTTILDKWRSYLGKIYELQISNLEAQKTAMQNITSQREYENKLIAARNKLENAQNEKHMVYREGVGMVFEADQEAVAEAQKELDQLENEKIIDQLDMTITELQSQKKWLEDFDSRNEFQNLAQSFEGVGDKLEQTLGTKDSGLWGTVNTLLSLYRKVNRITSEDFTKDISYQNIKNKEEAQGLFDQSLSEVQDYQNIATALAYYREGSSDRDTTAASLTEIANNTKSAAVKNYATNLLNNLNKSGWSTDSVVNAVKTTRDQRASAMRNAATTASKLATDYKVQDQDVLHYTDSNTLSQIEEVEQKKPLLAPTEIQSAKTKALSEVLARLEQNTFGGFKHVYSNQGTDLLVGFTSSTGVATDWKSQLLAALYDYFSQAPYAVDLSAFQAEDIGYQNIKDKAHSITQDAYSTMFDVSQGEGFKGRLKFLPGSQSYETLRRLWPDATDADFTETDPFGNPKHRFTNVFGPWTNPVDTIYYKDLEDLIDMVFNTSDLIPIAKSISDLGYSRGSLGTHGGLSSISEVGPELFATPGLSGTALIPEGSKVIPADATKGLWQLGSLASQFIKPLQSMLGGYSSDARSFLSTDESTNIQTLYVTLKADKDFDAEKFVQQLKMLQAISKHNNI